MNFRAHHTAKFIGALALCLALTGTVPSQAATAQVTVSEELVAILALPEDKIDLTETLLLISRHWDPRLDTTPLKKTLDRLTESARNQLKGNP